MNDQTITAEQVTEENENNVSFIVFISLIATIGGFLFGFDSGVINGTVDGLQKAFNSDSVGTGFNVASMLLGCAVGAFLAGRMADLLGRRVILIIASVLFIISAWGSGIATGSFEFIIYRILGGLAVGAASVIAPAYISEVAPAEYRGRLTTIQQVAIITGLFVSFVSNYNLAGAAESSTSVLWLDYEAWRWMFWVELIPAFIFFAALLFIPESPRFLVASGKIEKARAVLTSLYGETAGNKKVAEIEHSLASDHHKPKMSDLLDANTKKVRTIVWVGIGLAVFQQLVGINVVYYYGAVLWQSVGFSESDALMINVISGAVSIGACLVTISLVDKIGRKPLLWSGSVVMALALGVIAFVFATADTNAAGEIQLTDSAGLTALIAANVYVFFFNTSWGPVMWVMLGEMFPNQIRGSGLAISGLFQWLANFGITMSFPLMLATIGAGGAYGFYAISAAVSAIFVFALVHETKGVELEDMEG
ncbi:sugar porter family MFS transporter [Neiella sp. HB171785]|uniref:D-xylose-proton symporter n=1 Tax=Neiella litorisoli TaxID=2771431 RepID=A0A8J6UIN3_9GAMM|nr:sugar porter family MFS transporter [Neiella litorisoli]MBD1388653.1 sugar porter family MFS transporter [Neiella litorisoli]